jgi:hypothetical protein
MATVNPTTTVDLTGDGSTAMFTWALTTADSDGRAVQWVDYSDRTFTATGTFGGGTLTIEGSNDGTNWVTLSDAAGGGNATATAATALTIVELTRFVRPNLTGSTAATVSVTLIARKNTPMRT